MKTLGRGAAAIVTALTVTLLGNWLGVAWLRGTVFASDSFYDGSAALVTLTLPALIGGLLAGWIGRERGISLATIAFAVFSVIGVLHPFWQIPLVSPESHANRVMHFFLYSPAVTLGFGTLGGWLGGQFATGKFTLADRKPLVMPGLED